MSEEAGASVELNSLAAIPLADGPVETPAESAPAVEAVAEGSGEAAAIPEAGTEAGVESTTGGDDAAAPADVQVEIGEVAPEEGKKAKPKKGKKKKVTRKASAARKDLGAALETFNSLSEDLRICLTQIWRVSFIASVVHFIVTLLLFIMGYSHEGTLNDNFSNKSTAHASPTIVAAAFGALTTCVYSFTSTYTTYVNATKKAITTRFYHNGAFLAAVIRSFFLIFFLWPGLVIYILHSLGSNFWGLVNEVDSSTRLVLALDIIVCVGTGIVDALAFLFASRRIALFKSVDPEEEEAKREEEEKKKAASGGEQKAVDAPDQEEEERKPITTAEYVMPVVTMVVYVVLFAVLILISSTSGWNSGTVLSVLVHLALLIALIYLCTVVLRKNVKKEYTRAHMFGFRSFVMLHMTAVVAIFWVTFSILLLAKGSIPDNNDTLVELNKSFFQAVFGLSTARTALCVIMLLGFLLTVVNYGVVLWLHQRALGILEEMASLNIRERTGQ